MGNWSGAAMTKSLKVGDHVTWNSEAGHVNGAIIKKHTRDIAYEGHTHHASEDEPQYEIMSDRSDHIALHKAAALRRTKG
jgi:hypothetical protein